MTKYIEEILAILDWFRTDDEMTYSAYCDLYDQISLLDDLLKKQNNCENCAIAIEDRQPVVRCKDCRYYNSEPDSHGDYCDKIHWSRGLNWFCADGERKSN